MSKRGLSFDEKKQRTLAYMHERREVFTLKELETGVSKAKGVGQSTSAAASALQSGAADGERAPREGCTRRWQAGDSGALERTEDCCAAAAASLRIAHPPPLSLLHSARCPPFAPAVSQSVKEVLMVSR